VSCHSKRTAGIKLKYKRAKNRGVRVFTHDQKISIKYLEQPQFQVLANLKHLLRHIEAFLFYR